ncbi:hypothetical protein NBRC3188_3335 [Acetobacter pasteurianus NBRC 3188]|uniref:Uncharacterized protein n=1 Tax=Acetobacter pasteurianus NBRC 3188 TaxID=1226663 RepID=A0A401WZ69_ACEPA|nr:hypothetical protein NBRC3188_3335 [Acetobacter pasteurianus NBRC 3188]
MGHKVFGNPSQAGFRPNQRLYPRVFLAELVFLIFRKTFDNLGQFIVQLFFDVFIQFDAHKAALVIDGHGCAILDRLCGRPFKGNASHCLSHAISKTYYSTGG